ncbi:MAG: hypothetical protein HY560_02740 [Gemmatimonadetes bacterium]|nr:hypothetical protein [Gemmatimonadota bacterium]
MRITRMGLVAPAFSSLLLLATFPHLTAQVPGAPKPPSLGITVGVKATTLGLGPEVGLGIGPRLGFRAGFNFGSPKADFTFDNIKYSVKLKLSSITGLVDLYLLGPIRLSGGLLINNNKLELSADPTIAVDIGSTTYQASDVGTITGTIDYAKKTSGYLGLGIGGRGKIGFIMVFGIAFTGNPRLASFIATTPLTGAAKTAFDNEVTNETNRVQTDLNGRKIFNKYPVVGFGLQIKI